MLDHPGLPVKHGAANAAFPAPAPQRASRSAAPSRNEIGKARVRSGVVFRESSRCSTIRACLSSTVPRTPPSLHRRRSERVDPPLLPGMRGNYLVFFNTGIKVSGGGPREPSLLIVNTSPAGCPWQFNVSCLLVEV